MVVNHWVLYALGKITFKTTKDIVRSDALYIELQFVSSSCETVVFCCSTIKIKIMKRGFMTYRNACAGKSY